MSVLNRFLVVMSSFFVLSFVFLGEGIGQTQPSAERITVVGEAENASGAMRPAAHKAALEAGLQQAVSQGILKMLGGDEVLFAEKKPLFESNILKNASLYVRNYQIQSEQVIEGKLFLKIQTEISKDSLKKELTELGVISVATAAPVSSELLLQISPGGHYKRLVMVRKFLSNQPEWVKKVRTDRVTPTQTTLGVELSALATPEGLVQVLQQQTFAGARPKVSLQGDGKVDVLF